MTIQQVVKSSLTEYRLRKNATRGNASQDSICQYNFWQVNVDDMWFSRFLKYRGIQINKNISFYSVFGNRDIIKFDKREVKIFVTGENVHFGDLNKYADNMLAEKDINLSLGFDYFEDERYMRFPLWLRTQFAPEMTEADIITRVRELRYPTIGNRTKFASLVARYDWNGTRSAIYNQLQHIDKIYCPSSVLHNDDSLVTEFDDNKDAYMRQFCFNICPENSNSYGYVTEKIFDAIYAGCIPIYWGSYNKPESDILNHDAIIFWNKDDSNEDAIHRIEELYHDEKKMEDFLRQPRLKEGAEEIIVNYFDTLAEKMKGLL